MTQHRREQDPAPLGLGILDIIGAEEDDSYILEEIQRQRRRERECDRKSYSRRRRTANPRAPPPLLETFVEAPHEASPLPPVPRETADPRPSSAPNAAVAETEAEDGAATDSVMSTGPSQGNEGGDESPPSRDRRSSDNSVESAVSKGSSSTGGMDRTPKRRSFANQSA